jgi:hypothetical protein
VRALASYPFAAPERAEEHRGRAEAASELLVLPPRCAMVAAVGLDRFLRLYDASSRASRAKVYCKQQLSAVAWLLPPLLPAAAEPGAIVPAQGAGGADSVPLADAGGLETPRVDIGLALGLPNLA